MEQILSAVIGALAVVCIPLAAWFARRATAEGRLTLRVERLGSIYALMPDSPDRDTFRAHLVGAIRKLNDWLDPELRKRRRVTQRVAVTVYLVGIGVGFATIDSVDESAKLWISPLVGLVTGVVIVVAAALTAFLLERGARSRAASAAAAAEQAAAAERIEDLRTGTRPPTAASALQTPSSGASR